MDTELGIIRRNLSSILQQFDYKKKELNEKSLKELVATVRKVEGIIPSFIDVLFEHLRREDCEFRLCILLVANHFFQRSHNFRLELISALQDFLVYTMETDPLRYPLPNTSTTANLLKSETLATLRCWIEKFGPGYAKLQKLEHFLKNSKSLDWENSNINLMIEKQREMQEQFQREVRTKKIVEHIAELYRDSRNEIERIQLEASAITELLFPHFCPLNDGDRPLNTSSSTNHSDHLHGVGNSAVGVTICIKTKEVDIESTLDNADLLNQLKDTARLLDKWHSKLGTWIGKLTEVGDSSALIKQLIDTKNVLTERREKCREFKVFTPQTESEERGGSDSEDSDFLEVEEKEGYEPVFMEPEDPRESRPSTSTSKCKDGQSTSMKLEKQQRISARKKEEDSTAIGCGREPPKLAMGLDLKYWGQSGVKPAIRARNQAAEDSFWNSTENGDDANVPTEDLEAYTCRQITFVGQMPTLKMCRAPLASGALCPRQEKHKCALHGLIIDRDDQGFPVNEQSPQDVERSRIREEQKRNREQMEYLRDVELATGKKLTSMEKRSARRNKGQPEDNSRQFLKNKLFDKRALKRVSTTLEQIQKARAERNFAHQFNYSLTRK